jgi:glycine dehydrogenase
MIAIREEIRAVEEGRADREDNPLRHAPHTAAVVTATSGRMRTRASRPRIRSHRSHAQVLAAGRPRGQRYGDRNLFCSCVPMSEYA